MVFFMNLVEVIMGFVAMLFLGAMISLYSNYKYRFSSVKGVLCYIGIIFMLLEIVLGFMVCRKLPTLNGELKTFILYFVIVLALSRILGYLNDAPWGFLQNYLFGDKKDKRALSMYVLFGALQHVICVLTVSILAFLLLFGGKVLIGWFFK